MLNTAAASAIQSSHQNRGPGALVNPWPGKSALDQNRTMTATVGMTIIEMVSARRLGPRSAARNSGDKFELGGEDIFLYTELDIGTAAKCYVRDLG